MSFGTHIRQRRALLAEQDGRFSLRQVAGRIGIQPGYLSKIERGDQPAPGEETIKAIAVELGEDPDVLLAMAGKVSSDLQEIIRRRPVLFASLIRQLKALPDNAVLRVVQDVKDGEW
jgi:transcriptional regulator with XRE-family HTH domain